MYYFYLNNDEIEKYEISYNKEELEDLKQEIIYSCNKIVHQEIESDTKPDLSGKKITNYHCKQIDVKTNLGKTKTIYRYTYDVYEMPYLVKIIDELINSNVDALSEIFSTEIESDKTFIDEKLELMSSLVQNEKNPEIKKEYLRRLNNLINTKKKNRNKKPIKEYCEKLRELINITLVDKLPISEADRIITFFNTRIDIKYSNENILELKKSLKNM